MARTQNDEPPGTPPRYRYLVEFACLQCGRTIGVVPTWDPAGRDVAAISKRCRTCGGQPVTSGDIFRQLVLEPGLIQNPRRGRPTTAMLAARAADLGQAA